MRTLLDDNTYELRMITIARTSYFKFVSYGIHRQRPITKRHGASTHLIYL